MSAPGVVRWRVTHRTEYRYDDVVVGALNQAHLVPRRLPDQACLRSVVTVDPAPDDLREHDDHFGNRVTFFTVQQPHRRLVITAVSEVERRVVPDGLFPGGVTDRGGPWEEAVRRLVDEPDPEGLLAREFVLPSPMAPAHPGAAALAAESFTPGREVLDGALDLMSRIHHGFAYDPDATTTGTTLDHVLEARSGVCQDFAHLGIAALRSVGLPARYVSGYLETDPPPGGEKLVGVDASHAWISVHVPGVGWVDLDPTNDKVPDERYITTAWGRDYSDVPPVKGVLFSAATRHDLTVAVDVTPC